MKTPQAGAACGTHTPHPVQGEAVETHAPYVITEAERNAAAFGFQYPSTAFESPTPEPMQSVAVGPTPFGLRSQMAYIAAYSREDIESKPLDRLQAWALSVIARANRALDDEATLAAPAGKGIDRADTLEVITRAVELLNKSAGGLSETGWWDARDLLRQWVIDQADAAIHSASGELTHPGISDEIAGRLFATTVSGGGQKPYVKIECQSLDDLHAVYSNLDRLRSGHALSALSEASIASGTKNEERRPGTSKLVYDKDQRTIIRSDTGQPALKSEKETRDAVIEEAKDAVRKALPYLPGDDIEYAISALDALKSSPSSNIGGEQ